MDFEIKRNKVMMCWINYILLTLVNINFAQIIINFIKRMVIL